MNMKLKLQDRTKSDLIYLLQQYMEEEFDESIGDLKAGFFYEFIEEHFGKEFYNKGVNDTRKFMLQKLEDLEVEMDQVLV